MTSGDESVRHGGVGDVDVQYSQVTCFIIYIRINVYNCIIIILICARAYIFRAVGRRRDSMSCVTRVAYNIIRVVIRRVCGYSKPPSRRARGFLLIRLRRRHPRTRLLFPLMVAV